MTLIRSVDPKSQTHWRVHAPLATHHGALTCREAECEAYQIGFAMDLAGDSPQLAYIRGQMNQGEHPSRKRHFTESVLMPGMVRVWFPPGTRCFREHRGVARDPLFAVQPGTGRQSVVKPLVWRDDMQEDLMQLKEVQRREGYPEVGSIAP